MATETRLEVYANAAGLLVKLGFAARAEPSFTIAREPKPVVALVTDAPPVLVGHAISQVATDPEPHLPTTSAKASKGPPGKAGDPSSRGGSDPASVRNRGGRADPARRQPLGNSGRKPRYPFGVASANKG